VCVCGLEGISAWISFCIELLRSTPRQMPDVCVPGNRVLQLPSVFAFLLAPSPPDPLSGLLRFLSCSSSREKLGPLWTAGVGKFSGLGNKFESGPERPKAQSSAKKLDGDGRSASDINRLGRADIGVSCLIWEFPLFVLPALLPCALL